jgi:hypothetical protein
MASFPLAIFSVPNGAEENVKNAVSAAAFPVNSGPAIPRR